MLPRALAVAIAGVLAVARTTSGQGGAVAERVRGVAFDSIRGKPLADAFVAIVGGTWSATTDSRGRFQFDRVPAGSYAIVVQHATLDTMGFSGLSARVNVTDGIDEVHVAVPSFATLWRKACGDIEPSVDSGFVYGTIRDAATNEVLKGALVSVVWYDSIPRLDARWADELRARDAEAMNAARRKPNPKSVVIPPFSAPRVPKELSDVQKFHLAHWGVQRQSDESGTYAVCGIPMRGRGIRVRAELDSAASDSVDVQMDPRVQRRDLRVGPTDALRRGTIIGHLTDDAGAPFPYARVAIAGAGESRSDSAGRFVLTDVPPGTRRVEVRFIGMAPVHANVEVAGGDTTTMAVQLSRAPRLAGMTVRGTPFGRVLAAEFDSRRKLGLGYAVDSTVISRYPALLNLLQEVPSLVIDRRGASLSASVPDGRGGNCTPTVWLDGIVAGYGNLFDLSTSEVVGLEVFTRSLEVPAVFVEKGTQKKCGVILVWTKYVFKNR